MENLHPLFKGIIHTHAPTLSEHEAVKPRTKKLQVQQLKKGDVLQSGEVVTSSPVAGLNTPRGKMELGINGFLKVWGKYTIISVKEE
jgi:hypothetical protein